MNYDDGMCNVCWGSHGCDLPAGHYIHQCDTLDDGPCCRLTWDGRQWLRHFWDRGVGAFRDTGDLYVAEPFTVTPGRFDGDNSVPTPPNEPEAAV